MAEMDLFLRLDPLLLILLLLILLLLILLLLRLLLDLTVDDWPRSLILLDFNRKLFLSVVSIGAIGDPISHWNHSSIWSGQIQRFWVCWENGCFRQHVIPAPFRSFPLPLKPIPSSCPHFSGTDSGIVGGRVESTEKPKNQFWSWAEELELFSDWN